MLIDLYVYILRYEIPIWICGRFYDDEHPDAFEPGVIEPFLEMESDLRAALRENGTLHSGPYWQTDESIVHELLLVTLDRGTTTKLGRKDQVLIRPAEGELFEGIDHVFFVDARQLILLDNEVIVEIVSNHHGEVTGPLDEYLNECLRGFLCRHDGVPESVAVTAIDRVREVPPRLWSWEAIRQNLFLKAGDHR